MTGLAIGVWLAGRFGMQDLMRFIAAGIGVTATGLAAWAWTSRLKELPYIAFVAMIALVNLVSHLTDYGRRGMVSVAAIVVWVLYYRIAYKFSTTKVIWVAILAGSPMLVLLAAFSEARVKRPDTTAEAIQYMIGADIGKGLRRLATFQGSAPISMWCIENYPEHSNYRHCYTAKALVWFFVPRAFWKGKPDGLGKAIPALAGMRNVGGLNVGAGMIGHACAEGGWYALLLYAAIIAAGLKVLDRLVVTHPSPLYRIPIASALGDLFATSRGEVNFFLDIMIISYCFRFCDGSYASPHEQTSNSSCPPYCFEPMTPRNPIRVCIQQPSLAAYRVPLYCELEKSKLISLKVVHGLSPGIPNCESNGFQTEQVLERPLPLVKGKALWHQPQISLATRAHSDVLVYSGNMRYASLLPGLLRAKSNGVASVLWGHHYSKSGGSLTRHVREKLFFGLSDCILCYSQEVAARIRKNRRFSEKTFVAPNSVEQEPIQKSRQHWLQRPDQLKQFQEKHGVARGPNLLFVSRIKPRNKLEILVEALHEVKKSYPGATAIVVGTKNEEQRRIKALAKKLGVDSAVIFTGAIYDELQLAPWFLSSDVFVYPAQIGLSLFHAFGYGLPVIAGVHETRRNPELEALKHGENGLLFDEEQPAQAAEAILKVLVNPELKSRLSNGAMNTVKDHFNMKIMAANFLEAILYAAQTKGWQPA